jgi:hypothetical protein
MVLVRNEVGFFFLVKTKKALRDACSYLFMYWLGDLMAR